VEPFSIDRPLLVGCLPEFPRSDCIGAMTGIDVGGGAAEKWKERWIELGKVFKTIADGIMSAINGIKSAIDNLFGTDVSKLTAGLVGLAAWKLLGAAIGGSILRGIAAVVLGPEGVVAILAAAAIAAGLKAGEPKKPEPVSREATTEELFAKEREQAAYEFKSTVEKEELYKGSARYREVEEQYNKKLAGIDAEQKRAREHPEYEPVAREHALEQLSKVDLLKTAIDTQTDATKELTEATKENTGARREEGAKPGLPPGSVTTTIDQRFQEARTRTSTLPGGGYTEFINVEKSLKEFNESLKSTSAFVSPSSRDHAKFVAAPHDSENTKATDRNTASLDRNTEAKAAPLVQRGIEGGFEPRVQGGKGLAINLDLVQGRPPTDRPQPYADYQRQMSDTVIGAARDLTGRLIKDSQADREAATELKAVESISRDKLTEALKVIESPTKTFAERFAPAGGYNVLPGTPPTMPPGPPAEAFTPVPFPTTPLTDAQYEEVQRKRHEEELRFRREDHVTATKRSDQLAQAVQESAPRIRERWRQSRPTEFPEC